MVIVVGNWYYWLIEMFGGIMLSDVGWGSKMLLGVIYFLFIYVMVFIVGGFWEVLFCMVCKYEVNEGFFVIFILFVLIVLLILFLW